MLERRKAEERRRGAPERPTHGADALFDFGLGIFDRHAFLVQVGMRPGVRADRVARGSDLLEDFRIVGGVLADREERSP